MDKEKICAFKGYGKTMREAFDCCFDYMANSECLNMVQLSNGDWVVGFKSFVPTSKEKADWEQRQKRLYED